MPTIKSCTFPNLDLDGGQSVIFNYTLTNSNPLFMCSDDLSAVVLDHVDSAVWVALTSATSAIIYLQDQSNMPETSLYCVWSTPLSSQSYVTYECINNGCFSIYVIIGVYMNSTNNTIIYVPLCNVTVLNAYIGGFMWSVLGSSITNPQVIPYPPISTYPPTTSTSTTTTGSGASRSDSLLNGVLGIVGVVVLVMIIVGSVVCYRQQ